MNVVDPFLSISRSCNVPVSRALADMRASLAGRGRKGGCCFRLCSAAAFAADTAVSGVAGPVAAARGMSPAAVEDIAPLLLRLKALGVHTLQQLPLLQAPSSAAVAISTKRLLMQQAIDESGNITKPLGLLMAQGFLSPELTRLLVISTNKVNAWKRKPLRMPHQRDMVGGTRMKPAVLSVSAGLRMLA